MIQEEKMQDMIMKNKMTLKYAFKQSLPVMAGYLVLGMGFGILLKTKGYGVVWDSGLLPSIYR